MGRGKRRMNYERAWKTLKAESGYRKTRPLNVCFAEEQTIKELMDLIEKRTIVEG
jgi:hypothetical protein